MADAATLEFRAVVAFLLEGVPHHVAGAWMAKKKDAQRDAAQRALGLFANKWPQQYAEKVAVPDADTCQSTTSKVYEEDLLNRYCRELEECGKSSPCWKLHWEDGFCHVVIELMLLGVPHQLKGEPQRTEDAARADTARRVLWYLRHPSFLDIYEPNPTSESVVSGKIPSPPSNWACDSTAEADLEVARRKTKIMGVQNRLQQSFSRELRPGVSVWSWDYEMDPEDQEWPGLCRAHVNIPVLGKSFTGRWVRGQRDAQLDTIEQVTNFMDKLNQMHDAYTVDASIQNMEG